MSRPAPTLATALADLSRVLATTEHRPPWLTAPAWRSLVSARHAAREAIDAHVTEHGVSATAEALGVSRSTLQVWREAGGWLARSDAAPAT